MAVALVAAIAAGCVSVGPDYKRPQTLVPPTWRAPLAPQVSTADDNASLATWWQHLDDPVLDELVRTAVAQNLDLAVAAARLREARARRGVAAADRFPSVTSPVGASRSRSSETVGTGRTSNLYDAGFDASWELDLFGGKRRALQAANADVQASTDDLRDVLVSLLSELAVNYVDLRTYQARLAIARDSLMTQEQTWQIASWRFQAGLVTGLDVDQARYSLEQSRAQIPILQTGLTAALNRLAVLTGAMPGDLDSKLAAVRPIPVVPKSIAVGVPADLLRRRPDVRRAERNFAAETARVGVATAALYPGFSLVGTIGWQALDASNLFTDTARASSAAINGTFTLFDAGRLRQGLKAQSAVAEQALYNYQSTVRTALEDSENALTAFDREQQRREALAAATAAAASAASLAREQYASGLADFQSVLDAERSLLSLRDQLALSEGSVTGDAIRLYKALGGGWTTIVPPAAAEADINGKP